MGGVQERRGHWCWLLAPSSAVRPAGPGPERHGGARWDLIAREPVSWQQAAPVYLSGAPTCCTEAGSNLGSFYLGCNGPDHLGDPEGGDQGCQHQSRTGRQQEVDHRPRKAECAGGRG